MPTGSLWGAVTLVQAAPVRLRVLFPPGEPDLSPRAMLGRAEMPKVGEGPPNTPTRSVGLIWGEPYPGPP